MESLPVLIVTLGVVGSIAVAVLRLKQRLRGSGRGRTAAERQALADAEITTRNRLPF